MIKVGILGASGYMGGEALRVLTEHPEVELVWATSRSGKPVESFHRNFYGSGVALIDPANITPVDVVFVALPSGNAMRMAADLLSQKTKIIDLGADFRLRDIAEWNGVYGKEHLCPDIAAKAVYGIPELHRQEIRHTEVVANPGCFSSAAIFGLAPLLKEGLVDRSKLIVDGLSGTAGAGAELDTAIHHPEIGNNIVPYNVVGHRHTFEIEQELAALSGEAVSVHFTTSYVPITRGILDICHAFPLKSITREQLLELYKEFYAGEPFIQIFDIPKDSKATWQYVPYPWVSAVSGTNYCHIGLDIDEKRGRIVVFSVLDSLGKGGSHAGVQNMNLLFGLDETTGLMRRGLHPY